MRTEMRVKTLRILCLYIFFAAASAVGVLAQGPPPGGPGGPGAPGKPGGLPPGSPGGPGGPGNTNGAHSPGAGVSSAASPQRNALQFGPVGRWWDDKSVVREIGLSRDQQKKMDTIFDANKPAILASYKTFLKAQAKLDAVNKDTKADKATVFAAIDAVNNARSDLQKATSAMLMQIRGEMDENQITRLEKLE
jgi:Spy/CpxP family protein refolding chaperone